MINKNLKGQVTIFIIIGVIIVGIALLFIFFRSDLPSSMGGSSKKTNSPSFLTICLEDKIKEAEKNIAIQGGTSEPELYKTFKFEQEGIYKDISYLCYNKNYYYPCINQEPMLMQHVEGQMKDYISQEVEECFTELGKSLENQWEVVDSRYRNFDLRLDPNKIEIDINAEISLTNHGETTKQNEFKISFPSKLYGLIDLAQEVVNQEARFCHFEYVGYMLLYPEWSIDKHRTSDSSIIYTLKHEDSSTKFRFAIRGCVIPPGF